MSDELYQTHFKCEICGLNVPVPDPDHPNEIVLVECDKCEVQYRVEFNRIDRPEGWMLDCTECDSDRFVTWDAIHKKETPWHPTCDTCGSRMNIRAAK